MSMQRTSFRTAAALMLLAAAAGCQSSKAPTATAMTPPQRAVVITGNGGSTVVYLDSADSSNPMMLCSTPGMTECPECKAAAIKYFRTGVLDPKCSRTGATRTATTLVTPTGGHN